jgi:hypothetical protein
MGCSCRTFREEHFLEWKSSQAPGEGSRDPPDLPLECHTVGRGSRLQDEPPHLQILCSVARASDASDRGGALATFSQILEPSGFLDLIYLWHT